MTGKVDKFLEDLGYGQVLNVPTPTTPARRSRCRPDDDPGLGRLGEGFNAKGGFAVAMLNLKDYGINVMDLMRRWVPAHGR